MPLFLLVHPPEPGGDLRVGALGEGVDFVQHLNAVALFFCRVDAQIFPRIAALLDSQGGLRNGAAQSAYFLLEPLHMRIFFRCDAQQPVAELRIGHALGMLAELGDVPRLIDVFPT